MTLLCRKVSRTVGFYEKKNEIAKVEKISSDLNDLILFVNELGKKEIYSQIQ
jgi:hypothetical protein